MSLTVHLEIGRAGVGEDTSGPRVELPDPCPGGMQYGGARWLPALPPLEVWTVPDDAGEVTGLPALERVGAQLEAAAGRVRSRRDRPLTARPDG